MRKIMVLMLMMISTLTLSACDMLGGNLDEIIDNATNIAETFTMEDQTINIGTEEYDWAQYVAEINENLPEDIVIEVVEDTIDYGTPGTYTVTLRLTAPDIDFTHTFNVTVVEGGLSPGEIIDGFEGDITYLQTFMDPIMNSDAKETVTTLYFDVNEVDYMTGEMVPVTYSIVSTSRVVKGTEVDLMSQDILINSNGELMPFSFYVAREDTSLTFYIESYVIKDMIGDELVIEELGLTEEYIMFTVEGDFSQIETLDYTSMVEGLTLYLEELMMDLNPEEWALVQADIEYLVSNVELFSKYLTLEYYMSQEGMSAELDVNEDQEVLMTLTMATTMYGTVITDLITDLETFGNGLDEVDVPDISTMPEYTQLMTILNGLQPMQLDAVYDPANPTQLSFNIDLTTLVNTLSMMASNGQMMTPPVNSLTIDVVVRSNAEVVLPETATDMNVVVRDVMKLMFVQEVKYTLLDEVVDYYENDETNVLQPNENVSLSMIDFWVTDDPYMTNNQMAEMFDLELSYIVNRGTVESPEYFIQLVWIDGQNVFVEEVGYAELTTLIYESQMIGPIIGLVNDEAFELSRLLDLMN